MSASHMPQNGVVIGRSSAQEPRNLKHIRQSQQVLSPTSPSYGGLVGAPSHTGISMIPSKILSSAINIAKNNVPQQQVPRLPLSPRYYAENARGFGKINEGGALTNKSSAYRFQLSSSMGSSTIGLSVTNLQQMQVTLGLHKD
jgi:hypothetical protein